MNKIFPLNLAKNTSELKRLIAENPDLPIVVIVGEGANGGDYSWMYCDKVCFGIDEILDCEVPYQEFVETDRINFEEQMEDWIWSDWIWSEMSLDEHEPTEEEFQIALAKEKERYEPYWKKVIAIYATN